MGKLAVVLGGGGVAGIAWEAGILVGLADEGVDVRNADLFVGTSAGSVVAAQLTSGISMDELFQLQTNPTLQSKEIPVKPDIAWITKEFASTVQPGGSTREILQRLGKAALETSTVSEARRREVIESRLPVHSWPEQKRLAIVAVDVYSGVRNVFERDSHVDLIGAVAASCAVPLVWPPVTINNSRYMDGGIYSNENADLALGCEHVLVLKPDTPPLSLVSLDEQLELLRQKGASVELVFTDKAMQEILASVGGNPLDPAVREAAAQAGRERGKMIASKVASFWN
ncbi:MAG TPA: patatin-like phospholipase family protein [Ktedonobacteraceae bacterium]|nr:patatin-like phospholipase family protein [Ktedonobacteraceae bacterium]